jgi:chorismate mutase
VERLSAELTEVTRERMYNVMEIGELKAQLTKQKQATENCEAMLSRMVEERNAAIAREEEARSAHMHELTRIKAKLDKTKYLKDLYVKMAATVTA